MFVSGYGNTEIVRELNAKGLKTGKGAPFKTNSLYAILQNIRYTGLYKYEDIEIPGGMPEIIDYNTYLKAQKRKNYNRTSFRRKFNTRAYPLTTKLFCSCCNQMMTGISGYSHTGDKYYYYHCKNRTDKNNCTTKNVRAEYIENKVTETLKNLVMDDETIIKIARRIYTT